jgi:hypothetical protein
MKNIIKDVCIVSEYRLIFHDKPYFNGFLDFLSLAEEDWFQIFFGC